MVFLSACEDLVSRTLGALPGLLARLGYLGGLRTDGDSYEHWGLKRTHGELVAQKACQQVHAALWLELLRTPLGQLWSDVEASCAGEGETPRVYLEKLFQQRGKLVPADLKGGSVLHFNSVLSALLALSRTRWDANRLAA